MHSCPGPDRNPCANSFRSSSTAKRSAARVCRRQPRRHIEEQRASLNTLMSAGAASTHEASSNSSGFPERQAESSHPRPLRP
eukprot:15467604-Alexandrium_andersonii.AAC.1